MHKNLSYSHVLRSMADTEKQGYQKCKQFWQRATKQKTLQIV